MKKKEAPQRGTKNRVILRRNGVVLAQKLPHSASELINRESVKAFDLPANGCENQIRQQTSGSRIDLKEARQQIKEAMAEHRPKFPK